MKRILGVCGGMLALLALGTAAAPAQTPPANPTYDRIVQTYLNGPWEDLETLVAKLPKGGSGLSSAERADVDYLWQVVQECRPAWWKACKAGKAAFKAAVWGRAVSAVYDPAKQGLQFQNNSGAMTATVGWPQGDMDNTAQAEHGFTKGDLNALGVWQLLGNADGWAAVPQTAFLETKDAEKQKLSQYLEFRGLVTGVYYAPPKSRRWGVWLGCAAYTDKNSTGPNVMVRKALGALFVADVVGRRDKYPSVTLPAAYPTEKPEETLALDLMAWLEKNSLTLAEDRALREALRVFGVGNEKGVRKNARVVLPNGLVVGLDPAQDAANQTKREAWLKAQWDQWEKRAKKEGG